MHVPKSVQFGCTQPQTKNGLYIGPCGSKRDSEGTKSIHNTPLFVVSTTQNCLNGRLDPHTGAHLTAL